MAEETKAQTLATQREPRPLAKIGFTFLPQTWEQLYNYAKEIAQTDFVPNDLRGKPGAVLACWQFGQEVGLAPMAALQSIAVINGRPSLWGDGALAVVRANPLCEYVRELRPDEALKAGYGECTVKRRDDDVPITRRFTKEEAEIAGLWGGKSTDAAKAKLEPWSKYPGRMLQMRARAWAMRDAIPEALRGISIREEVEDTEPRDVTPEPLKVPQPIKEEFAQPVPPAQPNGDSAVEDARQPLGGTPTEEKSNEPTEEPKKSIEEVALAEIAKYTDATFPRASALNVYLKGQSGKIQAKICQAYNDRKKELGL